MGRVQQIGLTLVDTVLYFYFFFIKLNYFMSSMSSGPEQQQSLYPNQAPDSVCLAPVKTKQRWGGTKLNYHVVHTGGLCAAVRGRLKSELC